MDDLEEIRSHISVSLELLEMQRKAYRGGVNEGILVDHFMSLKHGLKFLQKILGDTHNHTIIHRIEISVYYVKQKLYSLTHLRRDESVVMNLDHAYADLREQMKCVIIKPGTKEYHAIYPRTFSRDKIITFSSTADFLCKEIKKLVSSDCKVHQISPMMKELEDIWKMLTFFMEPFFEYAELFNWPLNVKEEEKMIFTIVADVIEKATCFIYLSFVVKMDDEMAIYLKNNLSELIIEETQIMKMYLILDTYSLENLKSHISMSMRLLEWNKKCYLGTKMGAALQDHFMRIKHGLQVLGVIHKISENKDLKLRIQHFVAIVKQKLYSTPDNQKNDENLKLRIQHFVAIVKQKLYLLPNNQKDDENRLVKLEQAYGELREEMQNVIFKPGTNEYDTLFPEILVENGFSIAKYLILKKIMKLTSLKLTSRCKADQICPMIKELEELRKKLTSLKPLFDYLRCVHWRTMKEDEEKVMVALTSFLDRATCLIYSSCVGKLNEDMLVLVMRNFSLLIEETEIKAMSLVLGIIFEDDLEADFDVSLSLLQKHEEYLIDTINEVTLEDHIMSLKHGIEFLKWIPKVQKDIDLRGIIPLARNVKQKLELLTYKQGDVSFNMDVNSEYANLREAMKNFIINIVTNKYDTLYPKDITLSLGSYWCSSNDFLLEKITTLLTSNCKADQIAPLKKELQDLQEKLTFVKPLCRYVDHEKYWLGNGENIFTTLLTKATFLISLSFIGKMDIGMVLWIKSNLSTAFKETNVLEMYTAVLNEVLHNRDYREEELYLLENLISFSKYNVESVNDASSKLYEALVDIHSFLLGLYPNVLLRKLHLLLPSFQAILGHSISIICSCYLEHIEVDISAELNCVLDLIKHIKSEAQEIKLYYFPRVDDLGFLEFFSGYLEDLMKNQESSMKEELDALHFEVHSLLSLAKVLNEEELNETPWTDIINITYQAEYIIDLYMVSSSRDLGLISSLSKIIEQLQNIRADVNNSYTGNFGHLCESLPTQDAAMTSTHLLDNDAIMGLQVEAKIINEFLLEGENKLDVISIVGMAGVGKTTLALALYKTPSVSDHFDILACCSISQSYQNRALLLSIVDQVNDPDKSHRSILDDEELADHFCRSLKKRRYLIVLDDVWDPRFWNYLKRYLPDDRTCSRILITTRNRDVADHIGGKVNELHGLSYENSWELFQKKMIDKEGLSDLLLNISKGIVENCKGLPLSIVIVAGILSRIERTEKKWNQIAESVSSFILSDPQGNCKAILELSYNHLPNHLRSCFLYMGSFPEDEEISVNHLIFLWIGEGLVRDTESDNAEEVARKFMEDIIASNLVIPAKERSGGGVKTFRIHDLLRDFCLDKAKEKHFFTLLDQRNDSRPIQDPTRLIIGWPRIVGKGLDFSFHSIRSMICYDRRDVFEIKKVIGSCDMMLLKVLKLDKVRSKLFKVLGTFPDISTLVHLRYLALGLRNPEISVCSEFFPVLEVDEVCSDLFQVLDIDDFCSFFSSISTLVHLRYLALGLQNRNISVLPSSISKLQNLQILILRCEYMIKVPDFIWDMVKLRHVRMRPEASFQVDGNRLENSSFLLKNLRSLSNARVSCGDSKWLTKLSGLQRLSCVLSHDVLEEEGDNLEEVDDDVDDNRLQMLSFNDHLTSLKMSGRGRSWKQRFIRTCQLPENLRKLTLSHIFLRSNDISKIGRPLKHLEVFKIYTCIVPFGYQWNVDDDDFPKLKVLKFKNLEICKWIASENSFPSLEQLWVEHCLYLDEIPLHFGYLLNLRFISVRVCAPSVDASAKEIENQQHQDQNTDMRVHIYPRKW